MFYDSENIGVHSGFMADFCAVRLRRAAKPRQRPGDFRQYAGVLQNSPQESSSLPDLPSSREESSSAPEVPEIIVVTSLTWNKSVDLTLEVGTLNRRTVTVSPEDAADKAVTYTSSNPAAATVDASGLVVCAAPGVTTITATADSAPDVTVSYTVTVVPKADPPPAGSSSPKGNWAASEEAQQRVKDAFWAYVDQKGAYKYVRKDYPSIVTMGSEELESVELSEEKMIANLENLVSFHISMAEKFTRTDILFSLSVSESKSDPNNYVFRITSYVEKADWMK